VNDQPAAATPAAPRRERILSGMQPTNDSLHLGNYLGALVNWVTLQDDFDAYYFVADLHACTVPTDPKLLRRRTRLTAAQYIAAGVDPVRSPVFVQSHVPEHPQLMWILSCITAFGEASRMTQFKDKTAKGFNANVGLFTYPILMAADILLYDAAYVPVGKDQKQHLEITRDLAGKLNDRFGEGTVKVPEPMIRENTAVVPGTDGQKMSKSYGNTIPIFGEEKAIRKLVMRMPTDSTPVEAPKPVEGSLLLALFRLFADDEAYGRMVASFESGGVGYGDYKKQVFEAYWGYFAHARERRAALEADPGAIDRVLRDGAARAREAASVVLGRVRRAVGLG